MENNQHKQQERKHPSSLLRNLNDLFSQFDRESKSPQMDKLMEFVTAIGNALGGSTTFFVVNPLGKILYTSDQLVLFKKLEAASHVVNGNLNLAIYQTTDSFEREAISITEHKLANGLILCASTVAILENNNKINYFIVAYQDITAYRRLEQKVETMYYSDHLTQLPNRRCFEKDLAKVLEESNGEAKSYAVLFIDLDRFKFFNDTLGHSVGDDLFISISKRLLLLEGEGTKLYRFGGDEFIFFAKNVLNNEEIGQFANQILSLFKSPYRVQGNDLMLTASVGISIYPKSATSIKKLLECADTAMHYAKERGKNTYQIFSGHMQTAYSEKLKIEAQLRNALDRNEFFLNYQPQIDLKSKKIIGVEALIRWENSKLGLVPPNDFIPLAEDTGLIDQIGDWVLKTACKQVKKWQEEKRLFIRVGVNISPRQFQRPDFVSKVERVLEETGLEARYVDLEITENGLMKNSFDCLKTLERLKQLGLKISIDDFGTGYSSLSYLKRFPIDTLKIDQSFVKDLINDHHDQAIVTSIINLAHNMKLNVIAEGVETVEIVKFLNRQNCDEMQGYLYSKPLLSADFEKFLKNLDQHETILSYN